MVLVVDNVLETVLGFMEEVECNGMDVGAKLELTDVLLNTFVIIERPGTGRGIPCCAPGATSADSALPEVTPFAAADPLIDGRFFDKLIVSLELGINVGKNGVVAEFTSGFWDVGTIGGLAVLPIIF